MFQYKMYKHFQSFEYIDNMLTILSSYWIHTEKL